LPEDYSKPIELPEGYLQIRPAAHAINGGIRVNEGAEATLRGLFAAGEVAAGPHGADRLGGGMVTNCQVFGERAGRFAGEYALQAGRREMTPESLELPLARLLGYGRGERGAEDVLVALQQATGANLMVTRNEKSLQTLIDKIQALRVEWLPQVRVGDAATLRRAIEVENSLLTAELMARAALMRRESRGSHFREDYPHQDDENWRVNIIFRQEDGDLRSETRALEIDISY
jgi:succinate dehydrogenase/fumarate reductase flavoprotein subunit